MLLSVSKRRMFNRKMKSCEKSSPILSFFFFILDLPPNCGQDRYRQEWAKINKCDKAEYDIRPIRDHCVGYLCVYTCRRGMYICIYTRRQRNMCGRNQCTYGTLVCLNRRAPGSQFSYAAIRDEANVSSSILSFHLLILKKSI